MQYFIRGGMRQLLSLHSVTAKRTIWTESVKYGSMERLSQGGTKEAREEWNQRGTKTRRRLGRNGTIRGIQKEHCEKKRNGAYRNRLVVGKPRDIAFLIEAMCIMSLYPLLKAG